MTAPSDPRYRSSPSSPNVKLTAEPTKMIAPQANHSKFYPNTHLVSTSKIKTL